MVIKSKRQTGFKGMIMGLHSALELYEILLSKSDLTFLITYKLSQDHLETFFSTVRSGGGYMIAQHVASSKWLIEDCWYTIQELVQIMETI